MPGWIQISISKVDLNSLTQEEGMAAAEASTRQPAATTLSGRCPRFCLRSAVGTQRLRAAGLVCGSGVLMEEAAAELRTDSNTPFLCTRSRTHRHTESKYAPFCMRHALSASAGSRSTARASV